MSKIGQIILSADVFTPKQNHAKHSTMHYKAKINTHVLFCLTDAPIVALSFGLNLDPSNIAEGNDVYFECKISANPEVYKVVWLHNVISNWTIFKSIFSPADNILIFTLLLCRTWWFCMTKVMGSSSQAQASSFNQWGEGKLGIIRAWPPTLKETLSQTS